MRARLTDRTVSSHATTPTALRSTTAPAGTTRATTTTPTSGDGVDRARTTGTSTTTTTGPRGRNVINSFATRAAFDAAATQGTGAGAAGMPEVKFLLDRQTGKFYFLPKSIPFHYNFAKEVLGVRDDLATFNRSAYLDPNRRYVAGTVTAFDNFKNGAEKGAMGLSFWSTDVVRAPLLKETYAALVKALPFAADKVVYRPGGESQEKLLEKDSGADKKALKAAGIQVVSNTQLTAGFDFMSLNDGKCFGKLRFVKASTPPDPPLTRGDIAIYDGEVPTTLPPLAGVATTAPQTYLSHIALKARQDDTPYAFSRDILKDVDVKALEGKTVCFEVTPTGYKMRAATKREADKHLNSIRPKKAQKLNPDLGPKEAVALNKLSARDVGAFGSKTTNVAELHKLFTSGKLKVGVPGGPEVVAPNGVGLPASVYMEFMRTAKFNATETLDEHLTKMMKTPAFNKDPAVRARMLDEFREAIEDARMPAALETKLNAVAAKFKRDFPGEDIRIRSSTNSEDLEGFNGAGLFDSYTFRWANQAENNRSFPERVQKVFSSVFTDRAFGEFDFNRVDPHTVAMSALLMPATEEEKSNGVVRWGGAIPGWDTITVNAQVGENLVTNPDGSSTPDQFVVGNYGFNGEAEVQYTATTNQPLPRGQDHVMTDAQSKTLFKAMKVIQEHFAKVYGREGDPNFNIECEFKILENGKLLIKQARPWVD